MSYVHDKSKRCSKTEVDLFNIPPTQTSLEKGRWVDYHPLSRMTRDPLHFWLPVTTTMLTYPKQFWLLREKW